MADKYNYWDDLFGDVPDDEKIDLFAKDDTAELCVCDMCDGLGRYVGFREVEDPCNKCGGAGVLDEVIALPSHPWPDSF